MLRSQIGNDTLRSSYRVTSKAFVLALVIVVGPSVLAPSIQATAQDTESAAPREQTDPLTTEQQQVAGRYKKLEELLMRSAELESVENPTRSALLQQAAQLGKQSQLADLLARAANRLDKKQYSQALEDQRTSRENLKRLLELLQSENRGERVREQRDQVRRWIEETDRLLRLQKSLSGRTEGGQEMQQASGDQNKLSNKAKEIAKELGGDKEAKDAKAPENSRSESESDADSNEEKSSDKNSDQSGKEFQGDKPASENKDKPATEKSDKDSGKDPKSGDPSESGKPGDQSKEGEKSGEDGKPKDAKNQDAKDQDGKPQEGKSDDGKSKDGESKDGKPNEGQKPDSKDADGKPSEDSQSEESEPSESGKSQEGESKGQSQQGQSQEGKSGKQQKQQEPKDPTERAKKRIEQAQRKMEEAKKALDDAERKGAVEKQREAESELRSAIEALEEILRQLREEEIERSLASLETRLRRMLEMQNKVLEETLRLQEITGEQASRQIEIRAGNLAGQERKILDEGRRAFLLLREEGSSTAFPEAMEQVNTDIGNVAERLAKADIGKLTTTVEQEIVSSLEEMVAALVQVQKDQKEKKQKQQGQPQQGEPGEQPLVDKLAELRLIRTLQIRINNRTTSLSQMLADPADVVGQAKEADILKEVKGLADRQSNIQHVTREIVVGADK